MKKALGIVATIGALYGAYSFSMIRKKPAAVARKEEQELARKKEQKEKMDIRFEIQLILEFNSVEHSVAAFKELENYLYQLKDVASYDADKVRSILYELYKLAIAKNVIEQSERARKKVIDSWSKDNFMSLVKSATYQDVLKGDYDGEWTWLSIPGQTQKVYGWRIEPTDTKGRDLWSDFEYRVTKSDWHKKLNTRVDLIKKWLEVRLSLQK